jgi:hypothetical protein
MNSNGRAHFPFTATRTHASFNTVALAHCNERSATLLVGRGLLCPSTRLVATIKMKRSAITPMVSMIVSELNRGMSYDLKVITWES